MTLRLRGAALLRYNFLNDISPDFVPSKRDSALLDKLLPLTETPEAIVFFGKNHAMLTSYWYWFTLSTLWVSYSGWSELALWKELFSSTRKNRETSLMKPSELRLFRALPDPVIAFRAHRPGETDWIAYTLDPQKAGCFAAKRGVCEVSMYELPKADVLALFTRRGEAEVLLLDKDKAKFIKAVPVHFEESEADYADYAV